MRTTSFAIPLSSHCGNIVTYDIKEGCSILLRQAEALKVQFGSALGELAPDGQTVTIPGISGRDPREISFRNLAYIIEARMEEILEAVNWEIENSGCAEKLSAGIVLTGGGAMLQNLSQLIRKKTGYDVRIGLPFNTLMKKLKASISNQSIQQLSVGDSGFADCLHCNREGAFLLQWQRDRKFNLKTGSLGALVKYLITKAVGFNLKNYHYV
jgi:cell division ATPase FtsA